ncbi:MAG: glycogen-binding domain-containing protein [Candidatus Poribacteria bacterium]|nr:glycogen-binding domain-containing protein [Candidatus Poribacteria bacterium]
MINHLKKIHSELYLPLAPESEEPPFKVTPINEPYLYTDANIYVDTFDNPNQSVKVRVSNVGGGRLDVERVSIPRVYGKWIKRAQGSKRVTLTPTSEPIAFELNLELKALPNPSSVNTAELNVISNSRRKTFSKILLGVQPPEGQSTNLILPEYLNFGEITVHKVFITDSREDPAAPPTEFLLIGDFTLYSPTHLEITQIDNTSFDVKISTSKGELSYELDLRKSRVVMPRQKETGTTLKYFQKTVPIPNVNRHRSSTQISSDSDWLVVPPQIQTDGYDTTDLPVSVDVEKLEPGRNVAELSVANKKISVWAWYKVVKETALTLNKEQPDIHHVEVFDEQETPLPIAVISTEEPYQSAMIFEDLDFQFPLTGKERSSYLIGDFNQWTPRTLFIKKRDDDFGITLSVSEGTYLYRAEIDDEMRLDPARLYEIVCCPHGVASKIRVNNIEQKVTLRNRSKQKIGFKLQSLTEWMRIKPETLVLPARKKREITAIIQPERLLPGLNLGWIRLESEREPIRSFLVSIYVIGMTNGAVPILRNSELVFPQIEQGKVKGVPLTLDIVGEGKLKGEVQPSTVLRFVGRYMHVQNETAFEPMMAAPLVQVLSKRPSNAYRKQIRASLVTDCYLANRRVHRFDAKYDMVHLVSDPPALYFPKVHLFDDPQYVEIMVKRSDGKGDVVCNVEIPDALKQTGLLRVENDAETNMSDRCRFVLNPQAAKGIGRVSESLHLQDKRSGMVLPIQFAVDFVGGQAKIDVNTQTQRTKPSSGGIPLVITNIGETELRIFEVHFKNLRFYLSSHLTSQQRTLRPGESIERLIKVKKTLSLLGKTTVRDTLIIRLNDPQCPNGVFEKEIQGHILGFRR